MRLILCAILGIILGAALAIGDSANDHKEYNQTDRSKDDKSFEIVPLESPFIIPLVKQGRVWSYVILSIALELRKNPELVAQNLSRIRNTILTVLMDTDNISRFEYDFHGVVKDRELQKDINYSLRKLIGDSFSSAIIEDINRNDL